MKCISKNLYNIDAINHKMCNLQFYEKIYSFAQGYHQNKYCLIKALMKEGGILITRSVTIKKGKDF